MIIDAVFARASDRDAIEAVAAAAGVPFAGLWLEAPDQILVNRTRRRRADPSDADPAVVRAQLAAGAGEVHWHRIAASGPREDVLQRATSIIAGASADACGDPFAVMESAEQPPRSR